MPKLNEVLFGKKGKVKKTTTLTPEQEQLMSLISEGVSKGTGPLADIFGAFNEEEFNKGISEPALKNFQEKILPMLQESFVAGGVGGSGERNKIQMAGTDLQSKLAELMYGAQQQQKQNKASGVNTLLGRQAFENVYKPGTEGIAKPLIGAATDLAGNYLTGGLSGLGKKPVNPGSSAVRGATNAGYQIAAGS